MSDLIEDSQAAEAESLIVGVSEGGSFFPVPKYRAHEEATHHLAISIFLFLDGELLLQQRAAHKYHSGGLWANACCSHPAWGESVGECAPRRLYDELGARVKLDAHGFVDYHADVGGGMTEFERAYIFSGDLTSLEDDITLNPDEVQAVRLISAETLRQELKSQPEIFSAWFKEYMSRDDQPLIDALSNGRFRF